MFNNTIFDPFINSVNDIYTLTPRISQGLNSDQRTGNQIEPKSLSIKLWFQLRMPQGAVDARPLPYQYACPPEDIIVHAYFLKSKQVTSEANFTAIPIDQLLSPGYGQQARPFDGSVHNAALPINTDKFTVIKHLSSVLTRATDGIPLSLLTLKRSCRLTKVDLQPLNPS